MRESPLDRSLMFRVVIGVNEPSVNTGIATRCDNAAHFLRWDGERLWIRGVDGGEREFAPFCERRSLIRKLAVELGFPGGQRLYELAKTRWYWPKM